MKIVFKNRHSFTLIELLVVLAIVAILSVVVIMTLNPAELLKQSRDSTRLSDMDTLNRSLGIFNTDVTSGFMGTSSIIYVSIPDTTSTCANLGLPTLPSGWSYKCVTATSSKLTNGNGWIPVNFSQISFGSSLSSLPVDPVNATSSNLYYTYISGGSWKLSAMALESQKYLPKATQDGGVSDTSYEMGNNLSLGSTVFPAGWIKVPGNSTFGTSDFYVMKYEPKCADASGNLLTAPDSGYQTYIDTTTSCTSTNSRYIASAAGGYPVTNVSKTTATTYCQSLGAHLITNSEWQTVAWNAQGVATNWSGGVVGSGNMGRGNSNGSAAQVASADDANGNYGVAADFTHRRTQLLSNGQTIWDLAGNVYEWNSDTVAGVNQPYSNPPTLFSYREFTAIVGWGTLGQQGAGPSNLAWNSTQGIGKIMSWDGTANATVYSIFRGGNWGDGTAAGIEMANMQNTSAFNPAPSLSFRCAR